MPAIGSKYRGSPTYDLVYNALIAAARNRRLLTYGDLAEIMKLPKTGNHMGRQTGQICGEISEDEVRQGRPMLSALVVRRTMKASKFPGPGFFICARELGRLAPTDDTPESQRHFWEGERQRVYAAWQKG